MLFVLILRFYFCKEIKLLCFLSFLVHSVNFAIIPSVSRFAQLHFNLHLVQVFSLLQPILISFPQPHLFGPLLFQGCFQVYCFSISLIILVFLVLEG